MIGWLRWLVWRWRMWRQRRMVARTAREGCIKYHLDYGPQVFR